MGSLIGDDVSSSLLSSRRKQVRQDIASEARHSSLGRNHISLLPRIILLPLHDHLHPGRVADWVKGLYHY
jgi:hypothetical protein